MNLFNALFLHLLLLGGVSYPLISWLGRYLVYLYHDGDAQCDRFFALERFCCKRLRITSAVCADNVSNNAGTGHAKTTVPFKALSFSPPPTTTRAKSTSLAISWLKLTVISLLLGLMAVVLAEWRAYIECGLTPVSALLVLPWEQLFNITCSYFTNTCWENGYQAAIESGWGRLLVLMPLGWLNASALISLAVILAESVFKHGYRYSDAFMVYLVRTILYLILPAILLFSILLGLLDLGVDKARFEAAAPISNAQATVVVRGRTQLPVQHTKDDSSLSAPTKNQSPSQKRKSQGNAQRYTKKERKLHQKNDSNPHFKNAHGTSSAAYRVNVAQGAGNSAARASNTASVAGNIDTDMHKTDARQPKKRRRRFVRSRQDLVQLVHDHLPALNRARRVKNDILDTMHRGWQLFYRASDLVTANGQIAVLSHFDPQMPLTANQQLRVLFSLWGALLIPAALTRLLGAYAGKRVVGDAVLLAMVVLLVAKIGFVAFSEASGAGDGAQRLFSASSLSKPAFNVFSSKLLLWTQTAVATATSLGNSLLDLSGLTASTQMASAISLVLGNLIWGSNGTGLSTMLFYLLFAMIWLELMTAKRANFINKVLKLPGALWLIGVVTLPSLVAAFLVLPELGGSFLSQTPASVPFSAASAAQLSTATSSPLSGLLSWFYYYLSMLQGNGAILGSMITRRALWLGGGSILFGYFLNSLAAIHLSSLLAAQPVRNKRLSVLLEYPLRALALLIFTIILNLLTILPFLMLSIV